MVSGAPMTSLLPVVIGKPSGENHSLKKKSASGPGKTIVRINGPRDPYSLPIKSCLNRTPSVMNDETLGDLGKRAGCGGQRQR